MPAAAVSQSKEAVVMPQPTVILSLIFVLALGFFYEYDRLHSLIVRNNPLLHVLSKLAWQDEEKVTRMSSRQCIWRS
jgi:hypothetical protein